MPDHELDYQASQYSFNRETMQNTSVTILTRIFQPQSVVAGKGARYNSYQVFLKEPLDSVQYEERLRAVKAQFTTALKEAKVEGNIIYILTNKAA